MYAVDEDLCTGCGLCVEYCPSGDIRMIGRTVEVEEGLCTSCGSCAESCPQDAIYEYEEVPALRAGTNDPAKSAVSRPPVVVGERRPVLARQQKAAAAVLLPLLLNVLFRLAGRASSNGGSVRRQPAGKASRGGHRWHGGR